MKHNLMLAVRKEKAAPGIRLATVPVPHPKKNEILVKVLHASICGTDIGIYNWIPWAAEHIKVPQTIGHELVGEVIEVNTNEITGIKTGDLVSSETHIFCRNCHQCSLKNYHICENMELFGISRDGSFAEYATIPVHTTWKNNPIIPVEAMSVQEPLGNAVNVVTKANVKDKKVLIVGLGPVGLCAGMVAKIYGAKEVIGINRSEYRRKLAQSLGFDRTSAEVTADELGTFEVVLEMSGSRQGIQTAFDAVMIGGKIIAFGIPKQNIEIDWGKYLINKELTIESVFGRKIWDTWKEVTRLLAWNKIDLRKIITHRFKLAEFEQAMAVMQSGECGKVLLTPDK